MLAEVLSPLADRVAERELRSTVRVDGFLAPIGDRRKNTYTSACTPARATGAASTFRSSRPGAAAWS